MNRHNHPVLEQLLQEAMRTVVITQRGSQDRLTPTEYRLRTLALRNRHIPSLSIDMLLYEPDINDGEVKEAILNLLKIELKPYLHEDRTHVATFALFGGSTRGSSVDDIFRSLLKAAIVDSPQWAALDFYEEMERGYLPYRAFFLLTGVKVETQLQVFDGISLIPLPSSSQAPPGFLPDSLVREPLVFLSRTLLGVDRSISPVLHRPEPDPTLTAAPETYFTSTLRSTDLAEFSHEKFLLALTLVVGNPVLPEISWTHVDDRHIFGLRQVVGSGSSNSSIRAPLGTISEAQVHDASVLYHKIIALPKEVERSLQIPIERWIKSKTNQASVDKMIDLSIAMESFYLHGGREQNSFLFRLRGSLYLGKGVAERKRLLRDFRQMYKYRSQAVHGGTLPDRVRVDGVSIPMAQYIERSQELFGRSLMKVIESGVLPDWESLELGGGPN